MMSYWWLDSNVEPRHNVNSHPCAKLRGATLTTSSKHFIQSHITNIAQHYIYCILLVKVSLMGP